jgi:Nickel responsive protein SCO4226-like
MNTPEKLLAVATTLATVADLAAEPHTHLYLDMHELAGVRPADVASAHQQDLAVQDRFGVKFLRYWVDEANGRVYCLAEAVNAADVSAAHAAAHGLVPKEVNEVQQGE